MNKILKVSPFGSYPGEDHTLLHDWSESGKDIGIQAGGDGIVFSDKGAYTTAFFEAFPKKPSCFIRGEGKSVAEAEENAWNKYQKILTCNHEMERRDRTDGYGYCKHCNYSAMVFEPLTSCCKCGVKTAYSKDFRGNYYCKKHSINKPKSPNPGFWDRDYEKRLPRKLKKQFKTMFSLQLILTKNIYDKLIIMKKRWYQFSCAGFSISPFSIRSIKKSIRMIPDMKRSIKKLYEK